MANKPINVLMSLKDKFTAPFKKTVSMTKEAQKQFKLAQNTVAKFGETANDTFNNLATSTRDFATGLTAAGVALAGVGIQQLATQSMEAANIQIQAEAKLEGMLKNVESITKKGANAYKTAAKNLGMYAGELQKTGILGDEAAIAGMAQLTSYQLTEAEIKKLSKGMLDLTAKMKGYDATADDVIGSAEYIGEAIADNITALESAGIFVDDATQEWYQYADRAERVAFVTKLLEDRVGGMNEAMAKTDQGKIIQGMNAWGDTTEEVGKKILPFKAKLWEAFAASLPQLQAALLPAIDKIMAKFDEMLPSITQGVNSFAEKLPDIIDKVGEVFSFIGNVFSTVTPIVRALLPVIAGLVAGFTAFNVISSISDKLETLKNVMNGVKAAGGLLNFVMAANPFALVAIAIGVLVGGFILLYQHSETFRNHVQFLWEKLKQFGGWVAETFAPLFSAAWEGIKVGFGLFVDVIKGYIDGVITSFKGIVDFIAGVFTGDWTRAWEGIKGVVTGIFDSLVSVVKKPLDFITGIVDGLLGKIKKVKVPDQPGVTEPAHNALGTSYFPGGSTYVNEGNRGELINLPSGSQIVPHDVAKRSNSAPVININLNVQGNVIGNDDFYDQCGRAITTRLKAALANI